MSGSADKPPLRIALSVYRGNPYCGGQGVYVRHLSAALVRHGHSVTVFSGQPYPELHPSVELCRIPSLDLYRDEDPFRHPRLRELERPADMLELATMFAGGFPEPRTFSMRLRKALDLRRGDFDILHDDQSLGPALLAVEQAGLPVIASVHHPVTIDKRLELAAATSRSKRVSLRRWYAFAQMQNRVARRLRGVITVSRSSAMDVETEMGVRRDRIFVVPVGVDTDIWKPLPRVARVPGRIMTTASSDVPLKGLAVLLEAVAKVRVDFAEAHLVVVGRLRPDSAIRAVIKTLGLEEVVSFVSGESDASLVARYASSALAVVPSLYEGFSLPAVEAMACGVPVIVTDGGALPEVVGRNGESALTVRAGDSGDLQEAICKVLRDPASFVAMAERGSSRVAERFTWDQTATSTLAAYRSVMRSPLC